MAAFLRRPAHARSSGPPPRRAIGISVPRPTNFRRSRFVAVMKLVLPAIAIALLAIVAAWPAIDSRDGAFPFGLEALAARSALAPTMVNPRLLGIDSQDQPFVVTAESVTRLAANRRADVYGLVEPKADITLLDGTWWALTAATGTFEQRREILDLEGDVSLFHDAGYEFLTMTAQINVKHGTAAGDDPVAGHGPAGTVTAEGFRMSDRGERITFTGKSRLVLYEDAGAR